MAGGHFGFVPTLAALCVRLNSKTHCHTLLNKVFKKELNTIRALGGDA